jgi:hypothetical protein
MRRVASILAVVAVSIAAATTSTTAHAAEGNAHPFGLGIEVGAPTGLTAKYYLGRSRGGTMMALQFGVGAIERYHDDGLHLHVDVLWHPAVLARTPEFTLPLYLGVGGRVLQHDDDYCVQQGGDRVCFDGESDTHVGVRVPFGLLMDFNRTPIDVFLELAVVMDFILDEYDRYGHDTLETDLNGALGVRYYF